MQPAAFHPALEGWRCSVCGRAHDVSAPRSVCESCAKPLAAVYDLEQIRASVPRASLGRHGTDLWRYRAVLPFAADFAPIRLGEGGTPLLPLPRLGGDLDLSELWLKEEAGNPTQSFKARGLALAVNGAVAFGRKRIALPSAGNAGAAAAAYAATAGLECRLAVPRDTPEPFVLEARALGAEVRLVDGTIFDAGRMIAEWAPAPDGWDVATFRVPFRLEGKKTLGYEIAEQSGWRLPDFIFYPTGGGTGLVGMWKAFTEMRALGWVTDPFPKLVSVQAAGCAPIVRAHEEGQMDATPWKDAHTIASGLRVPVAFADRLILTAIRETGGTALAVSDDDMLDGMNDLARNEGCFACPEGGATLAALRQMRASGEVPAGAKVVLFNTGSGLQYLEAWRAALARRGAGIPEVTA
jgi:threonine synthase